MKKIRTKEEIKSKVLELKERISKITKPCSELEKIRNETNEIWMPMKINDRRELVKEFMYITDRYSTIKLKL